VGSWLLVGDLAQSRHAADGSSWLSGAWSQLYGDEHVSVACLEGVDGQEEMFRDGGLALSWRQVLSLPTVHSRLSVWTAQKRTRLVAVDSASAPTRIARRIEACGIAAPPRCVIVGFCIVVVMCDHSGRQPVLLVDFRRVRLCTAAAYGHHLLSGYGYLLT
jgi:hypothetical protein